MMKKVLIIDDEIDLCLLLKNYFVRKHYAVYLSHTLADGIAAFEKIVPDVVFIDNNLPDGSGWETAPAMALKFPETTINLMSAYNPKEPDMPASSKYAILEKPVSLHDLEQQFTAYNNR